MIQNQQYLKALKAKKDRWGSQNEFWYDVYGQEPILEVKVSHPFLLLQKFKWRIAKYLKPMIGGG